MRDIVRLGANRIRQHLLHAEGIRPGPRTRRHRINHAVFIDIFRSISEKSVGGVAALAISMQCPLQKIHFELGTGCEDSVL